MAAETAQNASAPSRFALRARRGETWEIAAIVLAIAVRLVMMLVLLALLAVLLMGALETAAGELLGAAYQSALRELIGDELLLWIALLSVALTVLQFRLRARAVVVGQDVLALQSGRGRTLKILALARIRGVAPLASGQFFARLMWPGSLSSIAGPCVGLRGWIRVDLGRESLYLAPDYAEEFEKSVAAAVIPLESFARRLAGKASAAVRAIGLASLAVLAAIAGKAAASLASLDERTYSYSSAPLARLALRNLRTGDGADSKAWTLALERALRAGDSEVVAAVIRGGSRGGVFDLAGYDAKNAPCPRSLVHYSSMGARLERTLEQAKVTFRIVDDDAYERFRSTLATQARRACLAKGGYAYYFTDAARVASDAGHSALAIEVAVTRGDMPMLERLHKAGADLEARNWLGQTPVMVALQERRAEAARFLLARGADVAATDKVGRNVVFYAVHGGLERLVPEASIEAYGGARTALGETLVHAAVASGSIDLAGLLIKSGLPARNVTADGRTLMHYARGSQMILMLLDKGLDVNAKDIGGRTPLHYLVREVADEVRTAGPSGLSAARFETARMLIAAGADRRAADAEGRTPAAAYAQLFEGERPAIRRAGASLLDQRRIDAWTWLLDPSTNIAATPRLPAPG
jgi:ankyrin repeat protein